MGDFQIDVRGIDETCEALTRMPKRMVKASFAKALAAAAVPVSNAVAARAAKHRVTGKMVNSQVTVIEVDPEGKGGRVSIGFGKEGYKARLVEFGHRMVTHKPKHVEVGQVTPQPFMRPAAAESAEESVEEFDRSLNEDIEAGLPKDF